MVNLCPQRQACTSGHHNDVGWVAMFCLEAKRWWATIGAAGGAQTSARTLTTVEMAFGFRFTSPPGAWPALTTLGDLIGLPRYATL